MKQTPLTPLQPRHILCALLSGLGLLVDLLATPSKCRLQAAHCRRRAYTATDERLRALWSSLEKLWTKLGADGDEVQPDADGAAHEITRETQIGPRGPCASVRPMPQAHEVRILFPGRKIDDVTYRCEECGGEEMPSVPRAW
jgi:hypothetical protein